MNDIENVIGGLTILESLQKTNIYTSKGKIYTFGYLDDEFVYQISLFHWLYNHNTHEIYYVTMG